jgi:hypothetical protein
MAREITAPLPPGLGKILSEGSFSVPSHQRDYSWRQDEVSLLLDDASLVRTCISRSGRRKFAKRDGEARAGRAISDLPKMSPK